MDNVLYNDLCVKFWRVPFVVLVFTAFVFVSGAWGSCVTRDASCPVTTPDSDCRITCGLGSNFPAVARWVKVDECSSLNTYCRTGVTFTVGLWGSGSGYVSSVKSIQCEQPSLNFFNFSVTLCDTQCEADSIACINSGNPSASWNSSNCTCDTLAPPDTTYKCVNGVLPSGTYGERPVAKIYRCITTGSSSDVCTPTTTINGDCSQWNFCPPGEYSCNIPKDTLGRTPCTRSGSGTTSTGRCYYVCPDGSSVACKPTSTEYVAGAIWVGTCPERPPEGCLPPSPGPSSSSSEGPALSSSSELRDTVHADTIDPGVNIDYTAILNAIRDTLHIANKQREILEDWDVEFMRPVKQSVEFIEDYTLNSWQKEYEINNNLTAFQERGFNLTSDVRQDLDSSRLLLDEIKTFLANDSLKTYSSDTTANGLLRDIRDKIPSDSALSKSDSLKAALLRDTFRPYLDSAPVLSIDSSSLLGKLVNVVSSNFGRDSADLSLCSSYYACIRDGGRDCISRYPGASSKCVDGGTPLDGVLNVEMGILETLWDAIFGDDSTPIPTDDDSDTNVVLPPGFSSASAELQRANDSLGSFNVRSMVDSVRSMIDSAKKMNKDTTKIQPDSLWLDSSEARQYVEHILLPSGTGTDCFICHADLGTLGGLSDTTLKIHIDFSNFGGYNWCEIIRAVVRIATLVVCISLTLGSWAAAFGYNPKNDA